jgi:hypothetical protein
VLDWVIMKTSMNSFTQQCFHIGGGAMLVLESSNRAFGVHSNVSPCICNVSTLGSWLTNGSVHDSNIGLSDYSEHLLPCTGEAYYNSKIYLLPWPVVRGDIT